MVREANLFVDDGEAGRELALDNLTEAGHELAYRIEKLGIRPRG